MRTLTLTVMLSLLMISTLAQESASLKDCQEATMLYVEAEAMKEFFRPYALMQKTFDGPATREDERLRNKESLQTASQKYLDDCKGGGSGVCEDYARIRNATLGGSRQSQSEVGMLTNTQSCMIYSEGKWVTEDDAPAGGWERADWMSMYQHEKYHQDRCREENGYGDEPHGPNHRWQEEIPDEVFSGDAAQHSPYTLMMKDPAQLAQEELRAYEITQEVLGDFLENSCSDPNLKLAVGPMQGSCGASVNGEASISTNPPRSEVFTVRTSSDSLRTPRNPVSTGPEGKAEAPLEGECACCKGEAKFAKVLVYGGPDQSIMVKQAPAGFRCEKDDSCGSSSGDPHLRTYDGLAYDFHGVGEFVLSRTDTFEAQIRYQPVFGVGPASVGTAVATNLNGDRVAVYAGNPPRLTIGGRSVTLDENEEFRLAAGGSVERQLNQFRFTSPGYFVVETRVGESRIDVRVGMPPDTRGGGLFGDRNGSLTDDLRPGEGPPLVEPVDFSDLYGAFADAWRVTTEDTLFDYAEGESVETFANRDLPKRQARISDLDSEARQKAEAVCRENGVKDPINL